jgi:hypothetical protein
MAEVKNAQSTKLVTGKCRLSYAHLFEAVAMEDGGEKFFSCALLIPKSDKATIKKVNDVVNIAKEQGKTSKWGGKIPANLKLPLRDGDAERPDDEVYKGCYFINVKCKQKPGLVDKDLQAILDPADLYSGCYVRAAINAYPFNKKGNIGIAFGLNNIQKLADGEALGGRSRAEDDFEVVQDEDDDLI